MKKSMVMIFLTIILLFVSGCTEKTFYVTFLDYDNNVVATVEFDGSITPPEDPLQEGYVFDGWYTDQEYLDEYDEFDYDDVLVSDLTVYSKWVPAIYTVTINYGLGMNDQEVDYVYGEDIVVKNPPVKKGYILGDFYVNQTMTIVFDPALSPTNDFTVYASWIPKTVPVNYYENAPLDVLLFSVGIYNTHIVTSSGNVYAWGFNLYGMLGTEDVELFAEADEPVNITEYFEFEEDEIITQFSKEEHVLALTSLHRVFGWGKTEAYQLGYGSNETVLYPMDLTDELPLVDEDFVVSVSAGNRHSVFLTNEGRLIVTGDGDYGQFGFSQQNTPVSFLDVTEIVSLNLDESIVEAYAYGNSTLLYTSDHRILVAGSNYYGELGTGDFLERSSFTDITEMFEFENGEVAVDFQFGARYVLVLSNYGSVYSFGNNTNGQLGIGTRANSNLPNKIAEDIREIHACGENSAIIDNNGSLYMFGYIVFELDNFDSGATGPYVLEPELMFENFFDEVGPFSEFVLGNGLYWFSIDEVEYRGYGQNDFNQLFEWYNGALLNEHITNEYVLVYTDEATYGEIYELYFPDIEITRQLTKWYKEADLEHRYFDQSRISDEELNLYGVWEIRHYILTIHPNNIQQSYLLTLEYNEDIYINAERPGYVLEGWYLDEECTIPFTLEQMPNRDIDVYAKWLEIVPEVITVPYDGVFSSDYSEVLYEFTLIENQHFLLYADFEFGYFLTLLDENRNPIDDIENLYMEYFEEMDDMLLFSELLPAGTYYLEVVQLGYNDSAIDLNVRIALSDYFVPETRTLELVLGGDFGTDTISIVSGTILEDLPRLSLPMQMFDGWFMDAECTIPFDLEYMPNQDVTLYAKFIPIPVIEMTFEQEQYESYLYVEEQVYFTFTLTESTVIEMFTQSNMDTYCMLYDDNLNQIRANDDYQGLDCGFAIHLDPGTYTLIVQGLSGYESGPFTMYYSNNLQVAELYTITFDSNGGEPVDSQEYFEGDYVEFEMTWKEGYLIKTWYTDPELTMEFDWHMPDSNITLYAGWIETTALDFTTLPVTETNGFDGEEIVGYTFSITETKTLLFTINPQPGGMVFFVFTSHMEEEDIVFVDSVISSEIILTLEPGDYIIVVAGGTGDYEFSIAEEAE